MFELNATLVIFLISFGLFIFVLNAILLKPVGEVLERRAEKIRSDIEQGKNNRRQADEILNQYQEKLHLIRLEAQKIVSEVVAEAQKERNRQIQIVLEEGKAKLEESKKYFAANKASLLDELVVQETDFVKSIVTKLIGDGSAVSPTKTR